MPMSATGLVGRVRRSLAAPEFLVPLLLGMFHFWLMSRIADGNFFNSYPYISDDGFDWVTQGVALNQMMTGVDSSTWPVLRSPIFVMLTSIDHILGSNGYVIMFTQSASVAAIAALVIHFALRQGFGTLISLLLGSATYLAMSSYFHLWLLSDSLASCLMAYSAVSTIYCLEAYDEAKAQSPSGRVSWITPLVFAVLAGLTQTYGLVAMLVVCGTYFAASFLGLHSNKVRAPAISLAVIGLVLVFGIKATWAGAIPHGMEPNQFSLLKFDLSMLGFYRELWPLFFGAMVPTAITAAFFKLRHAALPTVQQLALVAICLAFAMLCMLYQWEDARFTFIYMPIAWLALVALCGKFALKAGGEATQSTRVNHDRGILTGAIAASAVVSITMGLAFAPASYWQPKLAETRIAFSQSWINAALRESPRDRFYLQSNCGSRTVICAAASYDPPWSTYSETMFSEYKRRALIDYQASITSPEPQH